MENPNHTTNQESIEKLAELISGIEIAMLTTDDPDGCLRSRPMLTQKIKFDGDLWFFTAKDSGKVHAIEADQQVNLSYASPKDHRYISVTGKASIVDNKSKASQLWNPQLKDWFPEGPLDPKLALIKVSVESAEYWDYKSSKMVSLLGFARSLFTGESKPSEHEKHDRLSLGH